MKIIVVTNKAATARVFGSFEEMEAAGYQRDGERVGGGHLREELRGQPCFKNLCGPCWGGDETPVRYEDWESYDRLSR